MEEYDHKTIPIPIPKVAHFKSFWLSIYTPIIDQGLELKMNLRVPCLELRILKKKNSKLLLETANSFIDLILKGFKPNQSAQIFIKDNEQVSFDIKDVKRMSPNMMARAIGRIVGTDGKMKKMIQKTSETQIMIKNKKVYIIGNREGIEMAKQSICRLIMGANPNSIDKNLKKLQAKSKRKLFESVFI